MAVRILMVAVVALLYLRIPDPGFGLQIPPVVMIIQSSDRQTFVPTSSKVLASSNEVVVSSISMSITRPIMTKSAKPPVDSARVSKVPSPSSTRPPVNVEEGTTSSISTVTSMPVEESVPTKEPETSEFLSSTSAESRSHPSINAVSSKDSFTVRISRSETPTRPFHSTIGRIQPPSTVHMGASETSTRKRPDSTVHAGASESPTSLPPSTNGGKQPDSTVHISTSETTTSPPPSTSARSASETTTMHFRSTSGRKQLESTVHIIVSETPTSPPPSPAGGRKQVDYQLILSIAVPLFAVLVFVIVVAVILCIRRHKKRRRYRQHLVPLTDMDGSDDSDDEDQISDKEPVFMVSSVNSSARPILSFENDND